VFGVFLEVVARAFPLFILVSRGRCVSIAPVYACCVVGLWQVLQTGMSSWLDVPGFAMLFAFQQISHAFIVFQLVSVAPGWCVESGSYPVSANAGRAQASTRVWFHCMRY
jgi:hypothetical protein